MITEDYVSFKTAKLLKERGFNVPCLVHYENDGQQYLSDACAVFLANSDFDLEKGGCVSCPTLQTAMKWLRETKDIQVVIGILNTIKKTWTFALFRDFDGLTQKFYSFKTYEEACEAAIKYALENLI